MSRDSESEFDVTIEVDGPSLTDDEQRVIDAYESNAETFLCKTRDYGNSFVNSAKVESILRHGEIRDDEMADIIARQIWVRGFMDKMSRFYQLQFMNDSAHVESERINDTLLDMSNYAIMLATQLDKYNDER